MKHLSKHEKQLKLLDDFCTNNRDEVYHHKYITLDVALSSDKPVYSKAINISQTFNSILHISKALACGDAIYIDPYYVKFTKDVYIFNILHNNITLFKQDSTLRINWI